MRTVDFEMFNIEGRMEAAFFVPEDCNDDDDDDFYKDKRFMLQLSRDYSMVNRYKMSAYPAAPSDNEEGWTDCREAFEL